MSLFKRDPNRYNANGEHVWHIGRAPIPRGEVLVVRGNATHPDVHVRAEDGCIYSARPEDLTREPLAPSPPSVPDTGRWEYDGAVWSLDLGKDIERAYIFPGGEFSADVGDGKGLLTPADLRAAAAIIEAHEGDNA